MAALLHVNGESGHLPEPSVAPLSPMLDPSALIALEAVDTADGGAGASPSRRRGRLAGFAGVVAASACLALVLPRREEDVPRMARPVPHVVAEASTQPAHAKPAREKSRRPAKRVPRAPKRSVAKQTPVRVIVRPAPTPAPQPAAVVRPAAPEPASGFNEEFF